MNWFIERARALGANGTINYKTTPEWDKEAIRLADGLGVHLVVEVGGKGTLKTLPGGDVTIEHRGKDMIEANGKRVELDRYSVSGVIWGRESLWFDSAKNLIATVCWR